GFDIIRLGEATPIFANQSLAKFSWSWSLGRQVKQMFEREQFDVVHIHCPLTPTLPLLIQLYADCAIIGHIHTMLLSKPKAYDLFHRFFRACLHDFDGLVAVSKVSAKPFEDWFGCRFEVIPNGIPVDEFLAPGERIQKYDDGKKNIFF